MKTATILSVLIITTLGVLQSRAQTGLFTVDSAQTVNFVLTNAKNGKPVGLAHIINLNRQIGSISDMLGNFSISFAPGDSLKITAIGYKDRFVTWKNNYFNDSLFYSIELQPTVYQLEPVTVTRFSTYDRFLREVLRFKPKMDKESLQLAKLQRYMSNTIRSMGLISFPQTTMGISFGKDWYVKQQEKLAEHLERERQRRIIERKYNPQLVSKLTGLTDKELIRFISFLQFSNSYILHATEYEIGERIKRSYSRYKELQKNPVKQNK